MSNFITEASTLTPEQKVEQWHNGKRKENLKACGGQKLHTYFDICIIRKYFAEAALILGELERRGEPLFNTLSDLQTFIPEALSWGLELYTTLRFYHPQFADGTFYNTYKLDGAQIEQDALNPDSPNFPGVAFFRLRMLYCDLMLAMATKRNKAVAYIKQALIKSRVKVNTIKEVLRKNIQDKKVQNELIKIVNAWNSADPAKLQLLDEATKDKKTKSVKYLYKYAGPVYTFGKTYLQHWEGETRAVTAERALVNLCKQVKDSYKLTKDFNLSLDQSKLTGYELAAKPVKKCPTCGARLTDGGFCPRCDDGAEDLDENVEKHDKLNPKLWDGDKLRPEVADKIIDLSNDFIKELATDDIKFKLADIRIVGSNCSYNYTDQSDLDVHIIASTDGLDCPDNLYPSLYNAYKSLWNKSHSVEFYGIPVEIFVEVEDQDGLDEAKIPAPLKSVGIYSVLNNEWIKEPEVAEIPDIDQEAVDASVSEWVDRYQNLLTEINENANASIATESLCEASDQARIKLDKIDEFLDDIYDLRSASLATEGEFGMGNLVFKELRNRGILDHLKELKNEIESKDYSLPSDIEQEPIVTKSKSTSMPFNSAKSQLLSIAKNYSIDVDCSGKFTIRNLSMEEAKFLIDKLSKADFVNNVNKKESGTFDLRTVSQSRLPKRFVEISGKLI